jgi:hypothetical protein
MSAGPVAILGYKLETPTSDLVVVISMPINLLYRKE